MHRSAWSAFSKAIVGLSACGGGGGSDSPVISYGSLRERNFGLARWKFFQCDQSNHF